MSLRRTIKRQNDVALQFSKHVFSTLAKDSNAVLSPASMMVILSLMAAGAEGDTLDQLLSYMKARNIDQVNESASNLIDEVLADASHMRGPCVWAAHSVWTDTSLSLKESFDKIVETIYEADCYQVDFINKGKEVLKEVNLWIEKQTDGLVKETLPPGSVTAFTRLILVNTLYFKALWVEIFETYRTRDNDFYLLNGSSVRVPFMTNGEKQYLGFYEDFQVLKLPYKQGWDKRRFAMYIYLPDAKDGINSLLEKMGSESGFVDSHVPDKKYKMDEFRIPKFKISFGFEAVEVLKELGLDLPFSLKEGGLTEIVDCEEGNGITVDRFYHKCFIEVNERGTEAGAASVATGGIGGALIRDRKDFVADHPFVFVIREDVSKVILFTGQVLDPSISPRV